MTQEVVLDREKRLNFYRNYLFILNIYIKLKKGSFVNDNKNIIVSEQI
jgi:hypothetical protein